MSGYKNVTSVSLVRLNLIYSQEVYFSIPNTLKKLQSIDSKAFKLAVDVLIHTNTIKSYTEAGMISLSENNVTTSVKEDFCLL